MAEANEPLDELEIRPAEEREAWIGEALPKLIASAKKNAPALAGRLAGVDPEAIRSRGALRELPVLRKSELVELQAESPPFGGFTVAMASEATHIFSSPGPIFELETDRPDYWRTARALHAAGFRRGDIVHNCFAYHLTPGAWIMDAGARALGCAVVPAGTGNTEQQVEAIARIRPQGYVGTPDYLKVLLDKADELGHERGSVVKALVSGGALFPSLRAEYAERGVGVMQCYATADLGLIAYETRGPAGELSSGMVVDEGVIVEIVRPGTGEPVPDGEVGEVVATTFNPDYPLIRFATGDLSAVGLEPGACGRTNMRIKGWMGRADQTTKVKGMFVHPAQVAEVVARHAEVKKARLVVDRSGAEDNMTLICEVEGGNETLSGAIAATLGEVCKVKGAAALIGVGELPNDGKVIDDIRDYEQG